MNAYMQGLKTPGWGLWCGRRKDLQLGLCPCFLITEEQLEVCQLKKSNVMTVTMASRVLDTPVVIFKVMDDTAKVHG